MKLILALVVVASANIAMAQPRYELDVCQTAVEEFAQKELANRYSETEIEEQNISSPTADFLRARSRGFEVWNVFYNLKESCIENYDILVRRSKDGKACSVIKLNEASYDLNCG